ncbi:hypothetical protein NX08_012935 [Xanthomonas vasicola]|nr:hypothetical protein NX08_012935 [Xanthomonas vasicola]
MRRSKEPCVIPPNGLLDFPHLPAGMGWRDPVRGQDYDRSEWEVYIVLPHASVVLARVNQPADQAFEVRAGAGPARCGTAASAFALALAWAKSRFDCPQSHLCGAGR